MERPRVMIRERKQVTGQGGSDFLTLTEEMPDASIDAEQAKRDMEKLKAEYQLHLKTIEDATRAKMAETVEAGRLIAKEIQDKAREEAQRTFDKTKAALDLEVAKARITMREEIANLSIQVAEKILGDHLNDGKQREKAAQLIDQLEKTL